MSADEGLREALRALKLSGMLDTLDARLAQARAGESATWNSSRSSARTRSRAATRPRSPAACAGPTSRSRSPSRGSTSPPTRSCPAAQIRDLAALRWLHAGESVVLTGPVGVGKTHVAQALGHPPITASNR